MREHSLVVLTRAVPEHGLEAGDVGTVVHKYRGGRAYEVEFAGAGARSLAVLTLESPDVRGMEPGVVKCLSSVRASMIPRSVITAKLTASVSENS